VPGRTVFPIPDEPNRAVLHRENAVRDARLTVCGRTQHHHRTVAVLREQRVLGVEEAAQALARGLQLLPVCFPIQIGVARLREREVS